MFKRSGRIGQAGHGTETLAKLASRCDHSRMKNKNIPSNNPEYRRRMKVKKEFEQLLLDEGHGTLFD